MSSVHMQHEEHTASESGARHPTAVPQTLRLLVVDDHPVMRRGVVAALADWSDIDVVAVARSGEDALALEPHRRPDVILVDLTTPGIDGVATIRTLTVAHSSAPVIAFTDEHDQALLEQAMQAGAVGFLLKSVSPDVLAQAIRSTYEGEWDVSHAMGTCTANTLVQPSDLTCGQHLTPREQEVLALLVEGLTNQRIAERLAVSLSTVVYHITNLQQKLGTTNRTATAIVAWQRHLV